MQLTAIWKLHYRALKTDSLLWSASWELNREVVWLVLLYLVPTLEHIPDSTVKLYYIITTNISCVDCGLYKLYKPLTRK